MQRIIITIAITLALLANSIYATGAEPEIETEKINYMPNIHGTVRTRWEVNTYTGDSRFQVRNARLSVDGKIAPCVNYFINTDLCDRGKIMILDAWGQLGITKQLKFRMGQFRMPFGVDAFRAPHNYIFANRSFMGNQVCNVRAVGAQIEYVFTSLPLQVEAGVFNPTPIGEHVVWNSRMAYSGKVTVPVRNIKFCAGAMSLIPAGVRANLIDGAIGWSCGRWQAEGEYMYKSYAGGKHPACHAYNLFVNYKAPVQWWIFSAVSGQCRFDGMTDHSNATPDEDGKLSTTHSARNRATAGFTLSYSYNKVWLDLRANYEKYICNAATRREIGATDRALVEMVIRF